MASESVIELGSSEDEAEPATKKSKPNAMVHIPNRLCDVKKGKRLNPLNYQISKSTKTAHNLQNQLGENIVVTKLVKPVKAQPGTKIQAMVPINKPAPIQILNKSLMAQRINPLIKPWVNKTNVKKVNEPHGMPSKSTHGNRNRQNNVINPICLPPSITIKRTKRPLNPSVVRVSKKVKPSPRSVDSGVMETVELDDEDTPAPRQWYLKPEEHENNDTEKRDEEGEQEQINNSEPNKNNMIEITIEDSPIKPVQNKRTQEVGNEHVITIEDSPGKSTQKTVVTADSSDISSVGRKTFYSKKQLEYPNDTTNKSIEIEIEPIQNKMNGNESVTDDTVVEIFESPKKKISSNATSETVAITESQSSNIKHSDEFHPVYQNFIDVCLELENSDDMNKIVEKKIKSYYRQAPKEYTKSEEFIDMVSSKILCMKSSPEKLYLFIKDIVDELNVQRKMAKSQVETKTAESDKFLYGEDSEFDSKRQRQIRKLEKTLKKLHRAIQKLEEQEVDFDDDEDSVYLLTDRYKERMVRVHAKFCQLTNTKMPSEPRIYIDPRPGRPTGPAKRLEKWINKKVPIGTPLPFPDFHDVLKCVKDANVEDKLGLNDAEIMEEAHNLFSRCGKKLQRRRQENEWRLAASRIAAEIDPADVSEDLKKKLDENQLVAVRKEAEVYNKFADKQNVMNLEPEEIGDKEADESPIESEEEDIETEIESNLEDKEKRKEKLRKIVSEKCKRDNAEKENVLSEQTVEQKAINKPDDNQKDSVEVVGNENTNKDNDNVEDKSEEVKTKDTNEIDSDIDELHLLQKLHSDKEGYSSGESSGCDSPINISDSYGSDSDEKAGSNVEIISIENSSFSESECEENNDVNTNEDNEQSSNTTNDDDNSVESIASPIADNQTECFNIIDDSISVRDTVVENQEIAINEAAGKPADDSQNLVTEIVTSQSPQINDGADDSQDSVSEIVTSYSVQINDKANDSQDLVTKIVTSQSPPINDRADDSQDSVSEIVTLQSPQINDRADDSQDSVSEIVTSHSVQINDKANDSQDIVTKSVTSQSPPINDKEVEKPTTETDTNIQDTNAEVLDCTNNSIEAPIVGNESDSLDLQIEVSNICSEEIFKDGEGGSNSRVEEAEKDDTNLSDMLEEMQSDLNSYDQVTPISNT